jgi:hypothetical protein
LQHFLLLIFAVQIFLSVDAKTILVDFNLPQQ